MAYLLKNCSALLQSGIQDGWSVAVSEGAISALYGPDQDIPYYSEVVDIEGDILAPGLIDLQVNGGGGVLFNDEPTVDTLARMVSAHRPFGITAMLPTLITSTPEVMRRAADTVNEAQAMGMAGIAGIHFEGPMLNRLRKGVHEERWFRKNEQALFDIFTSISVGATLVTLAPECVDSDFIRALVDAGVTVSLGHSNADFEQATRGFDAGISTVTHLFNAMPPITAREPGAVVAALLNDNIFCAFIADRQHVATPTLELALAAKSIERLILVSDAMAGVGPDASEFSLNGAQISVRDGACFTPDGTLAGSALSMLEAVRNVIEDLGISLPAALSMASTNPANLLGLAGGRIEIGCPADLIVFDRHFRLSHSIIRGDRTFFGKVR